MSRKPPLNSCKLKVITHLKGTEQTNKQTPYLPRYDALAVGCVQLPFGHHRQKPLHMNSLVLVGVVHHGHCMLRFLKAHLMFVA